MGEALGEGVASGDIDVDGAGKEMVDDVEVVGGEAGDGIGGKIDCVGIGDGRRDGRGGEGSGGDSAGTGTTPERRFGGAFVDNKGTGGEITKALAAAIAEHGDDADGVEAGKAVDGADEVARQRFEKGDLAAGVADDAELAEFFAGGLAVPEGFEDGVVAPAEEKDNEEDGGDEPFLAGAIDDHTGEARRGSENQEEDEEEDGVRDELHDGVREQGEEAAADAGDGEADGDLLRSVDGKLVGSFGHRRAW